MNDYELNKAILSHNNGVLFKLFLKQSWLEKKNEKKKQCGWYIRMNVGSECVMKNQQVQPEKWPEVTR